MLLVFALYVLIPRNEIDVARSKAAEDAAHERTRAGLAKIEAREREREAPMRALIEQCSRSAPSGDCKRAFECDFDARECACLRTGYGCDYSALEP